MDDYIKDCIQKYELSGRIAIKREDFENIIDNIHLKFAYSDNDLDEYSEKLKKTLCDEIEKHFRDYIHII